MATNLAREHQPSFGKLTWSEEGHEGGTYHSRKIHVPSDSSGATIGRGYDMKTKSAGTIRSDMKKIELKSDVIEKLVQLAGLSGEKARNKINELGLKDHVLLEPAQQLALFKISYAYEAQEAKRLCTKTDVVKKYGDCNWSSMNTQLKEFIIDLKYQGLYSPDTRMFLQKAIVERNYEKLKQLVREKLPSKFLKRNLNRIKLLQEAEWSDKYNGKKQVLPAQLDKNNVLA